jgi:hypothetical protein
MSKPSLLLPAVAALLVSSAALAMSSADFDGKPSQFVPGRQNAAAVWLDATGLHVRFTTDGARHRFIGKVCAKEKAEGLKAVDLEADDALWLGPEGKCVWFKFWTEGQVDGFDVNAAGNAVLFDLEFNQRPLLPEQIWIGKDNKHPEHSPFALQRD